MKVKKLVLKVGTNLLVKEDGTLDKEFIITLASTISKIMKSGVNVSLVSSGARAAGFGVLRFNGISLREKQALCAIGQVELMKTYESAFDFHGIRVAQLLLTRDDFHDRKRFLNLRNTLITLMELNVVPIINENDTVVTEEIEFGDNDILAAMYAIGWGADHLMLLTTVDGVINSNGKVVRRYTEGTIVSKFGVSKWGSGGIVSKLEAAKMALNAGIKVCICNGRNTNNIYEFIDGKSVGTIFEPGDMKKRKAKKMWIGFLARSKGVIMVNEGAANALRKGKSLLAVGIISVDGKFQKGDIVRIVNETGECIGKGMVNYSSNEVERIKGMKSEEMLRILGDSHIEEVIHADNFILTC